jgi:AcrR family transcriptional regulator
MTESAISLREQKRWDTACRITLCAQRLADARGIDGFTMDELADAAEVSRRTLFNYFPSKTDAVLGEAPEIAEADLATFVAGGPHGNLVDDLAELARIALAVKQPDRESLELGRRVLNSNPRLLACAHERFESVVEKLAALVLEREGDDYPAGHARLLLHLLLALFDTAMAELTEDTTGRTLVEAFEDQLAATRSLFATPPA